MAARGDEYAKGNPKRTVETGALIAFKKSTFVFSGLPYSNGHSQISDDPGMQGGLLTGPIWVLCLTSSLLIFLVKESFLTKCDRVLSCADVKRDRPVLRCLTPAPVHGESPYQCQEIKGSNRARSHQDTYQMVLWRIATVGWEPGQRR